MSDLATISRALDPLRAGLQADGFELVVDEVATDGRVTVRLAATPEACLDCLLPDDQLQMMVASSVREAAPDVREVVLTKSGFDGTERA